MLYGLNGGCVGCIREAFQSHMETVAKQAKSRETTMNDRSALARDSMALWLLAVLLSIFAANTGKLTARSRQELFDDPVISGMGRESPSDTTISLDELNMICSVANCQGPVNCHNESCQVSNCSPVNCTVGPNSNCP